MLEEEFLELMVHLFRNLPMGDIWQTENRHRQAEYGDQEAEILHELQVRPLNKSCLTLEGVTIFLKCIFCEMVSCRRMVHPFL